MLIDDPTTDEAIGKRLEALRKAKKIGSQEKAASAMGIERSRYANWENGTGKIPVDQAIKLKNLTGVTLDYIYTGDASALPLELAISLGLIGPISAPRGSLE